MMGKEDFGLLGLGVNSESISAGTEAPTLIPSLQSFRATAVSGGGWHTIILTDDGCVYACGKGEYGRLGLGNEISQCEPYPIVATSAGSASLTVPGVFAAATSDAFAAGPVSSGDTPTAGLPSRVERIAAGGSHTMWSTSDGRVFTVGRVDSGRLGIGQPSVDRFSKAIDISNNFLRTPQCRVQSISAGGAHSCVIIEYPEISQDDVAGCEKHMKAAIDAARKLQTRKTSV